MSLTFVLIHGGGCTGGYWDRLAPLLAGDVIAVDLPGRRSRPGDLAVQTLDQEVEDVLVQIREAEATRGDHGSDARVVIVAHSSGGSARAYGGGPARRVVRRPRTGVRPHPGGHAPRSTGLGDQRTLLSGRASVSGA